MARPLVNVTVAAKMPLCSSVGRNAHGHASTFGSLDGRQDANGLVVGQVEVEVAAGHGN